MISGAGTSYTSENSCDAKEAHFLMIEWALHEVFTTPIMFGLSDFVPSNAADRARCCSAKTLLLTLDCNLEVRSPSLRFVDKSVQLRTFHILLTFMNAHHDLGNCNSMKLQHLSDLS